MAACHAENWYKYLAAKQAPVDDQTKETYSAIMGDLVVLVSLKSAQEEATIGDTMHLLDRLQNRSQTGHMARCDEGFVDGAV